MNDVAAGAVGERMGLPCNPEKAYTTARHKHNAREALRAAGIATPKSSLMKHIDDADSIIANVCNVFIKVKGNS
jgi:carbamoylphosphate synthase large subunit